MKTRNGFVSNSSSSSFVMIGSKLTQKELNTFQKKLVGRPKSKSDDCEWEDDLDEAMEENGWLYDGERSPVIVGKILAEQDSDTYCLDDASFTVKELMKYVEEAREALGKEPRLIMGTRAC